MKDPNALHWFELYTADFDRAKTFYQTILAAELTEMPMPGPPGSTSRMAVFPSDMEKGVGGAIVRMDGFAPGPGGTLVYLAAEGTIDTIAARIPAAGGSIVQPKFSIAPHGFIALFADTEGNIVGLHSMS